MVMTKWAQAEIPRHKKKVIRGEGDALFLLTLMIAFHPARS